MARNVLAAVVAVIAGMIVVAIVQMIIPSIYPFPEDLVFDPTNPDDRAKLIEMMPTGAHALVILAHSLGALTASLLAAKISKEFKFRTGMVAGMVLVIATITNFINMGHSMTFGLIDISLSIIFTYIGAKMGSKGEVYIEV